MDPVDTPLMLPRDYGKYRLQERIGAGGMAEVYRAILPGIAGFEKTVVIKRLHPKFSRSEGFVQMFIDEAKLAAQVQHKNVVQVFELGSLDENEFYIAMEYVAGIDLKKLLWHARKNLKIVPVWLTLHVAIEVLEALAFANALQDGEGRHRNIVHCDVTPENVFISRHGEVKLGDFGVAVDDTRTSDPFPGQIKGKIPYMSPEQVSGHKPTAPTDVFAMGIVLWECLTQRRLFHASSNAEVMAMICHSPRLPPSRFNPDVTPEIDGIVLRALEINMDSRTSSALDIQAELVEALARLRPRVGLTDVRNVIDEILGPPAEAHAPTDAATETADLANPPIKEPVTAPLPKLVEAAEISDIHITEDRVPSAPNLDAQVGDDGFTYALVKPRHALDQVAPPGGLRAVPRAVLQETDDILRAYLADDAAAQARGRPVASAIDGALGARGRRGPISEAFEDAFVQPAHHIEGMAPYGGPHPVWIRTPSGEAGPLSAADALSHLRRVQGHQLAKVVVSGDGLRWSGVANVLRLLGEELVDPELALPSGSPRGRLELHSLVWVCGELARNGRSGRLILERSAMDGIERREIHVRDGYLTDVVSSHSGISVWELFLRGEYFDRATLEAAVHRALIDHKPLDSVGVRPVLAPTRQARIIFVHKHLEELFGWESGRFAFDPNAKPSDARPSSFYALLPRMVMRTKHTVVLRSHVAHAMETPLERTEEFNRIVGQMNLRNVELEGLAAFGNGRTLQESLTDAGGIRNARTLLTLGYILLELEVLVPSGSTSRTIQRSAGGAR